MLELLLDFFDAAVCVVFSILILQSDLIHDRVASQPHSRRQSLEMVVVLGN